jgi:hypothetical protein
VNAECSADGTDTCLQNQDTGEHFCASPCQQECPPGYSCTNVQGLDQDYCAPDRGTCIDRCAGVRCPAGQVCDPVNGQCGAPPCSLNTDCPANHYCGRNDGLCYPTGNGRGAVGAACQATADCAPGTICGFGTCVEVCDTQADCAAGLCINDLFDNNRLVCFNLPGQ